LISGRKKTKSGNEKRKYRIPKPHGAYASFIVIIILIILGFEDKHCKTWPTLAQKGNYPRTISFCASSIELQL